MQNSTVWFKTPVITNYLGDCIILAALLTLTVGLAGAYIKQWNIHKIYSCFLYIGEKELFGVVLQVSAVASCSRDKIVL